ncbi:hypothetical protein ASD85_10090 [Rhizobium sp. Root651]|nr:hypothetical protein ASD85_10090 [Rhizobium sp. Root651]
MQQIWTACLALDRNVIGDILLHQLSLIASDVRGAIDADCRHFIPDQQPTLLLEHSALRFFSSLQRRS